MLKVAKLDADDVFIGMEELADESQLGPQHLKQIPECDLPPGQYRWMPDVANPFGGQFVALKYLKRKAQDAADVAEAESIAAARANAKGRITKRAAELARRAAKGKGGA